ncbi:MAG: transporter substrate-binding protein, partial [Bacilli bacterium]|nr:transporter substrate-binding protein [Bacilli bacterium]
GADFHVEAFYNVKGTPQTNDSKLYREKPSIGMVSDIGRTEFQDVLDSKKTVKEALKDWQTKGDAMLQKIKENPKGQIDQPMIQNSGVAG